MCKSDLRLLWSRRERWHPSHHTLMRPVFKGMPNLDERAGPCFFFLCRAGRCYRPHSVYIMEDFKIMSHSLSDGHVPPDLAGRAKINGEEYVGIPFLFGKRYIFIYIYIMYCVWYSVFSIYAIKGVEPVGLITPACNTYISRIFCRARLGVFKVIPHESN